MISIRKSKSAIDFSLGTLGKMILMMIAILVGIYYASTLGDSTKDGLRKVDTLACSISVFEGCMPENCDILEGADNSCDEEAWKKWELWKEDNPDYKGIVGSLKYNYQGSLDQIKFEGINSVSDFVDFLRSSKFNSVKVKLTISNLDDDILKFIYFQSQSKGINPFWLLALMTQESVGDAKAINEYAVGLMQLKACTARDRNLNVNLDNIIISSQGKCSENPNIKNSPNMDADERFDSKKNIQAGFDHLVWIRDNLDEDKVNYQIAAYHIGLFGIQNDLENLDGKKYFALISRFYSSIENHLETKYESDANGGGGGDYVPDFFRSRSKIDEFSKKYPNLNIENKFGLFLVHGLISPRRVILHHTGGNSLSGAEVAMRDHPDNLGIHFMIDRSGQIFQYASLEDKVYHAGPANSDIGIEIVNSGNQDYTDLQYGSIKSLLKVLSIEIKNKEKNFVIGHLEVIEEYGSGTTGKWDPSPNFNWNNIEYPRSSTFLLKHCKNSDKFKGICYLGSENYVLRSDVLKNSG